MEMKRKRREVDRLKLSPNDEQRRGPSKHRVHTTERLPGHSCARDRLRCRLVVDARDDHQALQSSNALSLLKCAAHNPCGRIILLPKSYCALNRQRIVTA